MEVTLRCAVYGKGASAPPRVLNVHIPRNALTLDLAQAIIRQEKFAFSPGQLRLRLAWKLGEEWLQEDKLGKIDEAYALMRPSRRLFEDEGGYMKADFNPSGDRIHVLVELPKQRVHIRWIYPSLLVAVFCFLFWSDVSDLKDESQSRYLFLLFSTGFGIIVFALIGPASSIAHPIKFFQGILRIGPNYTGIGENTLPRDALTELVIDMLDQHRVVLFRSPPMTGKTVFAALISRVLARNRNNLVLRFSVVGVSTKAKFETWFQEKCGVTYGKVKRWTSRGYTIYFVVDEVQLLFKEAGSLAPRRNSETFWEMVQEALTDSENNIRFLMFASYGSTPMYSIASAPVDIPDDQILGIDRLSFTREEIKAYVDNRFLGRECLQGDTVSKFCSRLQLLTSNHVGLVVAAIDNLNEIYLSCTKSDTALPPAEDWIHLVEEGSVHQDRYNSGLFEALNATRALKVVKGLRPGDLVVLKRFLYEDVDSLDAVIQNLISVGVLVETLKFSSAAMWRYVVSKCTSHIQREVVVPSTLQDLVVQAIRDINYDHVSKTLGTSLATGIPLERAWQMEFYLAAYRCTPRDTFVISADVGSIFASPGFIDFTVHYEDDFWGIELLRERRDRKIKIDIVKLQYCWASILYCSGVFNIHYLLSILPRKNDSPLPTHSDLRKAITLFICVAGGFPSIFDSS